MFIVIYNIYYIVKLITRVRVDTHVLSIVLTVMIDRSNSTAHLCKTSARATFSNQSFLREVDIYVYYTFKLPSVYLVL